MKHRFYNFEIFPYHITGHYECSKFESSLESSLWECFLNELSHIQVSDFIKTISFVLMGNHFHLLCVGQDLESVISKNLLPNVQKSLTNNYNLEIDFNFKDIRYFETTNIEYFKKVYKYIYRNPVEAGLAGSAELYPYSSLKYILRGEDRNTVFIDNMNLLGASTKVLHWINNH
jgi:putative transposase